MTKRKLFQYSKIGLLAVAILVCFSSCNKYKDGFTNHVIASGTINDQNIASKSGMSSFFGKNQDLASLSWAFDAGQATVFHIETSYIPLNTESRTKLNKIHSSAGLTYDGDQHVVNYEVYEPEGADNWIRIISYNHNFRKVKFEINCTYIVRGSYHTGYGNADPFNKADTLRVRNLVVDVVDK
jgi:hypothetical protein